VKVFSWYDNEWGYCAMLIKHIEKLFTWSLFNFLNASILDFTF
jgi:hypothetical protein